MKKVFLSVLCLIAAFSSQACDLCGLYSGVMPKYDYHFVGMRMRYRTFNGTGMHQHTMKGPGGQEYTMNMPGDPYQDVNISYDLMARYFVTEKLNFTLYAPYSVNMLERGGKGYSLSGPGDPTVLALYRILAKETEKDSGFQSILNVGGGVKMPLGRYHQLLSNGDFNPHNQLGTGSTDFLLTANYMLRYNSIGLSADVMGRMNTTNPDGYRFGNRLNSTLHFLYWIKTQVKETRLTFLPQAGLYGEYAPEDYQEKVLVSGTGGRSLFFSGGMDFYIGSFSFNNNIQIPITQKMGSMMPDNTFRFISSLTYYF